MFATKSGPGLLVFLALLAMPGILPAQVVPVGKDLGVAPDVLREVKRLGEDGAWWEAREALLGRAAKGEEMEVLRGLSQEFARSTGEPARRAELVGREINALMDRRDRERRLALAVGAAREAVTRLKKGTTPAERDESLAEIEAALARIADSDRPAGGDAGTAKKEPRNAGPKDAGATTMTRFRLEDGKEVMVPFPEGANPDDYEAVMKNGQVMIKKKAKPMPAPKKDPAPNEKPAAKEG